MYPIRNREQSINTIWQCLLDCSRTFPGLWTLWLFSRSQQSSTRFTDGPNLIQDSSAGSHTKHWWRCSKSISTHTPIVGLNRCLTPPSYSVNYSSILTHKCESLEDDVLRMIEMSMTTYTHYWGLYYCLSYPTYILNCLPLLTHKCEKLEQ